MNYQVDLPDYRRKAYLKGDYAEFKYNTELIKARKKICFLSGKDRKTPGASKIEMEFKKDTDPNIGPGFYTPLLPCFAAQYVKKAFSQVPEIGKDTELSESLISIDSKDGFAFDQSKTEKKKILNKDGLLWGKRDEMKDLQIQPGPADTPIARYPENLQLKPNKIPFNISSVFKHPLTITTIASKSSADQYEQKNMFKSAFEARKELDVPVIVCARAFKDICIKCKNEIDEDYFFIKGTTVIVCRKCHKDAIRGSSAREHVKMSMFKQGRYCTRYHLHHKLNVFDKLIPNRKLYKLLTRELYHQQYSGSRFVDEGIPSKDKAKTSTEGSKIYQRLFPDGSYNTQEICTSTGATKDKIEGFNRGCF